jgi:hypothetical protein
VHQRQPAGRCPTPNQASKGKKALAVPLPQHHIAPVSHTGWLVWHEDRGRCLRGQLAISRGEGSVVGLQLRVRFVPAALLAMLRTALALQCISKARDWTDHVDR